MSFTEPLFLLYLAVCVALNRLCPLKGRAAFLLAASYLFYCTWSPRAALLLAVLTLVTFAAGLAVEKAHAAGKTSAAWLAPLAAILITAYLMAFKIALLTPAHGIGGLIMPLGISYYSFKLISYVLDIHWQKIGAEKSLLNFGAYVAFFPQIVAGPIQRPGHFFEQLPAKPDKVVQPLLRIMWGFFKKLMIADNLAPLINAVYGNVTAFHGAPLWVAFYLFPLQLYADFSGLTDIAIGSGQLFGITGPENFNRPFTATTISDFWRRWHMSLTSWLGDYVFVPLRMALRQFGMWGLCFALLINLLGIGLWHGMSGNYIAFGLVTAFYFIVEALTSRKRAAFYKQNPQWDGLGTWLGWFTTIHLTFIGKVFWRAKTVPDALWLLEHLWSGLSGSVALLQQLILETGQRPLLIGLIGYVILELSERFRLNEKLRDLYIAGPRWVRWSFYSGGVTVALFGFAILLVYTAGKRAAFLYEIF